MQTIKLLQARLGRIESWDKYNAYELKIVTLELMNYLMDKYIINRKPIDGIRIVVAQLQEIYMTLQTNKGLEEAQFETCKRQIIACIDSATESVKAEYTSL